MRIYLLKITEDDTVTDPVSSILVTIHPSLGLAKMLSNVSWPVFTNVYVADYIILLDISDASERKI